MNWINTRTRLVVLVFLISGLCFSFYQVELSTYVLKVPSHFPVPKIPEDNKLSLARVTLGEKLFFDPILSKDSTVSCGSCHHASIAFSDSLPLSRGIENRIVSRNSPSIINVAYQPYLMRDGGVPTLEMQILVPIQEHAEFDFNILKVADRLRRHPYYAQKVKEAYSREPDAFVITRAIAAYERTLIGGNSKYDAYLKGDKLALSPEEKRGLDLFTGRLNCVQCHSGLFFTNFEFENTGLYTHYADSGRARITKLAKDRAKFKVPSLRNVAVTAPYMHNGSMKTLSAVIDHYQSGGKSHRNKNELIKGFELSKQERTALLAFLTSLTDKEYLRK